MHRYTSMTIGSAIRGWRTLLCSLVSIYNYNSVSAGWPPRRTNWNRKTKWWDKVNSSVWYGSFAKGCSVCTTGLILFAYRLRLIGIRSSSSSRSFEQCKDSLTFKSLDFDPDFVWSTKVRSWQILISKPSCCPISSFQRRSSDFSKNALKKAKTEPKCLTLQYLYSTDPFSSSPHSMIQQSFYPSLHSCITCYGRLGVGGGANPTAAKRAWRSYSIVSWLSSFANAYTYCI